MPTQPYVLAAISAIIWILESFFEYSFQLGCRNLALTVQHEIRVDACARIQSLGQA